MIIVNALSTIKLSKNILGNVSDSVDIFSHLTDWCLNLLFSSYYTWEKTIQKVMNISGPS